MSKVKINKTHVEEIQKEIETAKLKLEEATNDIWGTNFDNLYHNMVTNKFLEELYKDSESNFNRIFGLGTTIIGGGGAILSGTAAAACATGVTVAGVAACIPIAGWIIAAVILAILAVVGIVYMVKSASDVQFKYDAKKVLEDLLTQCWGAGDQGTQMNYDCLTNLDTKLQSVKLTMSKILLKVDEFNTKYANLASAAESVKLKNQMKLAADDITVLSIDTEVNINGEKVTLSVSDAMNAFFTYESSVMAAEISAAYMKETYGIDVDYKDIVKNANAFMVDTIKSGLYSHEFIHGLLPSYEGDYQSAIEKAAGDAGLATDKFVSVLDNTTALAGSLGGLAGLVGAAYLGKVSSATGGTPTGSEPGNETGGSNNGTTEEFNQGENAVGGNTNSSGGNNSSSSGNSSSSDATNPNEADKEQDKDNSQTNSPTETIKLEEIRNDKLPVELKIDKSAKDYDAIARDEYESQGIDKIEEYRRDLTAEINKLFDDGQTEKIKEKLKEYGYSGEDVSRILEDRDSIITAVLANDEKKSLLEIVDAQTKVDEIKDYDSIYDEIPKYSEIEDGTESTLLVSLESSEDVKTAKKSMNLWEKAYEKAVENTNASLKTTQKSYDSMTQIQEKYTEKFGEDTSKWDNDALKEYQDAIHTYNENVEKAQLNINGVDTAKKALDSAEKNYKEVKTKFLEEIKKQNDKTIKDNIMSNDNEGTKPIFDTGVVDNSNPSDSSDSGNVVYSDEEALKDLNKSLGIE